MSANTRHLRLARSRLRASITLLRLSRGLESMPKSTAEILRLLTIELEEHAESLAERIAEANEHLERQVASRRDANGRAA